MNWSDLGLSPALLELISKAGYATPTPVQEKAIPFAIEGHDVLASAATGSGKTAGFVLPTVQRYLGKEGTFILALSPTREIAQQTAAVFETFGGPLGLRSTVLIGGANIRAETTALATYPQIIVATPGRLVDHLERGNIWLDFIQTLILDEADRMLDMGFSEQLARITDQIPKTRQTLMFSATFPASIEKLARQVMHQPKEVRIGATSEAAPKIEQRMVRMREEDKMNEILRVFKEEPGTIIVFARSKDRVSRLWRSLHSRLVYDATYLHSDCTQAHREKALADFKAGTYRILIATDVAGRGIDVDDVAHVINYDLPMEAEDYVHRIGRTGRRGRTGKATTFVTDRDREIVKRIEKIMGTKQAEREQNSREAGIPVAASSLDAPFAPTFGETDGLQNADESDSRSGGGRSARGPRGDRSARAPRESRSPRETRAPREKPPAPVIDPSKPRVVISLSSKSNAQGAAAVAKSEPESGSESS
ncbi:MAG: DEAD/DEAH box helicase [Cryobacterium sp.]|nr:DEAD/DEAH box helicase [Oligoflexia bacterium]